MKNKALIANTTLTFKKVLSIFLTLSLFSVADASTICSEIFANTTGSAQQATDQSLGNSVRTWGSLDRLRLEINAFSWPGKRQAHFDELLSYSQTLVEKNLGFNVEFSASVRKQRTTIKVLDSTGETISYGEYRTFDGGLTLIVFYIHTSSAFRKNNLSKLVLAKMLAENPKTQRIKTSFAETNKAIFDEALATGDSPLEAIRKTPSYKIRAELGFSRIVYQDFTRDGNLTVEKD